MARARGTAAERVMAVTRGHLLPDRARRVMTPTMPDPAGSAPQRLIEAAEDGVRHGGGDGAPPRRKLALSTVCAG